MRCRSARTNWAPTGDGVRAGLGFAAALALTVALAGCGGSADADSGEKGSTGTAATPVADGGPGLRSAPERSDASASIPTPGFASHLAAPRAVTGVPGLPAAPAPGRALAATDRRRGALGMEVVVDGARRIEMGLESLFVMPGDTVHIDVFTPDGASPNIRADGGSLQPGAGVRGGWAWIAPSEAGLSRLEIVHPREGVRARIHAFTLVPADRVRSGRLGAYRIGSYPAKPLRGSPLYRAPEGFVEVTAENATVRVSPHFQLGHFTTKQGQGFPKYVVLRPELLTKLEWILEAVNDRGYPLTSFHVMSGYRTPYYNVNVLGNVPFSRHQWGGAADIYIDERPRDGRMDDLDGNGRVDIADAHWLYSIVDSLESVAGSDIPVGGLGLYASNAVRGPFVHVDVRGTRPRW